LPLAFFRGNISTQERRIIDKKGMVMSNNIDYDFISALDWRRVIA